MRLPEGWKKSKLSEKLLILKDGTHYSPQSKSGSFMYLTSKNIRFGKLDISNVSYISEEEHKKIYKGSPVKNNDLLLTKDGANTGNAALNTIKDEFSLLSSVAYLRGKPNVLLNEFLLHLILSPAGQSLIKSEMAGQAITRLTLKKIGDLQFLFPSYPEQQKIAQILSTWDKTIEKLEVLIAAKQKRKKALMQQLLTGKKRFPGIVGEWKELHLSDIFQRVTRKNIEKHTNVVTISAQKGLIKQEEFFNKNVSSEILDHYFLMHKGEFAYNKSYSNGYPMGAIKRLNNYDKAVVTSLYICFAIKDESKSCGNFFEQYFESGRLINGLMKVANEGGRAHGLLNVTPKDFFELKLTIPGFIEQQKIAAVLSAADKEITTHKNQLVALKQQRTGLMQQLLTGKKRVNVNQAAA